jgi:hypothetical protein
MTHTKTALMVFRHLATRDNNPIYRAKSAKTLVKEITLADVRDFLVQIPVPLLETLLSGPCALLLGARKIRKLTGISI